MARPYKKVAEVHSLGRFRCSCCMLIKIQLQISSYFLAHAGMMLVVEFVFPVKSLQKRVVRTLLAWRGHTFDVFDAVRVVLGNRWPQKRPAIEF